jgi:hypothetical protein
MEEATQLKYYKAIWSWNKNTDKFLQKWVKGYTLNFPCGTSQIGDVRADKDKRVKPDIIADLRAPEAHFKKHEFDTLLCDPPFSMFNRFYWIPPLCDLAKKRILFSTPQIRLRLPKCWKLNHILLTEQKGCMTFRIFQVFDRMDGFL